MPTGSGDVRFQGKTGSGPSTAKTTRLTLSGHRRAIPPNAEKSVMVRSRRVALPEVVSSMRRLLLLLGLILLMAQASAEERVWRLGVLTPFDWPSDTTMHSVMIPELARRGFVEGRNLVVLPRWGGNVDSEQLARLAQDLATAKPDVIIAVSPRAIKAAMKAAPQTPIVASFTIDPVAEGAAASMSRPGGEVTGIAMLASEGDKKRIELLHDAIPGAHKFAFVADEDGMTRKDEYRRAAENIGVEIVSFETKS